MLKIYNSKYEEIAKIGEGAFSKVYKARIINNNVKSKDKKMNNDDNSKELEEEIKENIDDNNGLKQIKEEKVEYVTLKKLKHRHDIMNQDYSIIKEVKILKELNDHPNVVKLLDVFTEQRNIILALEYMKLDLVTLIKDNNYRFTEADIKSIMLQLLNGIYYLHKNSIIHRDIKPGNILFTDNGVLKIADFGSARQLSKQNDMTPYTTTRYYRAPEMLYGSKSYNETVDIWGAGCVFAELLIRKPIFDGDTEIGQLTKIFNLRGTPNEKTWPDVVNLPNYVPFELNPKAPFMKLIHNFNLDGLDLLERMLEINPNHRISIEEALNHDFFKKGDDIKGSVYQEYIKSYKIVYKK